MNPRSIDHSGSLRHDPDTAGQTQTCGGVLALLEIAVVTTIVVGFFDAACQPLGWQSVAQFLLCACLAGLLWFADAKREADESFAGNSAVVYGCHQPARYELKGHKPARHEM